MTAKPVTITINDQRFPAWIRSTLSIFILCAGPIGVGVLVGSSAMQWMGFVFSTLAIIATSISEMKKCTFTSIDAARKYLDELDGRS